MKPTASRAFQVMMASAILDGRVKSSADFKRVKKKITPEIEKKLGPIGERAGSVFRPSSAATWKKTKSGKIEAHKRAVEVLLKAVHELGLDSPAALGRRLHAGLTDALYESVRLPSGRTVRLLDVNDDIQTTDYSCGPTALKSVLRFFGFVVGEEDLIKEMRTSPENGTPPEAIAAAARRRGLRAVVKTKMTLADLERAIYPNDSRETPIPVIIDLQAWREGADLRRPWTDVWESGHYVVAIGMDHESIYIEDPSLEGQQGTIPRKELRDRWHDYEGSALETGTKYVRAGILISGTAPREPRTARIR